MAENIIKDFVKKQTTPLTIGVPKQRPQTESAAPVQAAETPATEEIATPQPQPQQEVAKGHVGRPKSDIEKVKLSVYVPAEAKAKLIRIQHHNYKQSLNDVLLEAISDLIKKYGE